MKTESLFAAMLDLSLQGAVLAAIVFCAIKLTGRWIPAKWRPLLWCLVFARLLIPIAPPSPFSLQNLLPSQQEAPSRSLRFSIGESSAIKAPIPIEIAPALQPLPAKARTIHILGSIWLAGAALALIGLAGRAILLRNRLRIQGAAPEFLRTLAGQQRYPIRIVLSADVAAPALTGLFPAWLIVPKNIDRFTEAQRRHVLMHELAHVNLGHLFLHWAGLIARCIHWFNPLVHFAAHQMRQECELAADESALAEATPAERQSYGETLLLVLGQARSNALALGMAAEAKQLQHRMRAIVSTKRNGSSVVGVTLLIALALSGLSGAQTNSTPADPPFRPTRPALPLQDEAARLQTRSFKLYPNDLIGRISALGFTTNGSAILPSEQSRAVRAYFEAAGVKFEEGQTDPRKKALFYDDRQGTLFARATPSELDIIEKAIHALNINPSQVAVSVQFIDYKPAALPSLLEGVDLGPLDALKRAQFVLDPQKTGSLIANARKTESVDLLSAPLVTTLSGRQCRISIEEANAVAGTETTPVVDIMPTAKSLDVSTQVTITQTEYVAAGTTNSLPEYRVRRWAAEGLIPRHGGLLVHIPPRELAVPVLGNIPHLGPLFKNSAQRATFVLIQTTVIDAAGNEVKP